EHLADHPEMGAKPPELEGRHYHQIVEPPARVFYRSDGNKVFVLHVMRSERQFHITQLER
ncbi:MAG: type II toxin-antitoxin system RelE/ParE family toxin, partial [Nitrospirales bacterium]